MTPISNERQALLGNHDTTDLNQVDSDESDDEDDDYRHHEFVALKNRAWSFSQSRRQVATAAASSSPRPTPPQLSEQARRVEESRKATKEEPLVSSNPGQHYLFCFVYAVVNVIIAAPALYGYAAVIFNHPIFANHMNALSKRKEIFLFRLLFACNHNFFDIWANPICSLCAFFSADIVLIGPPIGFYIVFQPAFCHRHRSGCGIDILIGHGEHDRGCHARRWSHRGGNLVDNPGSTVLRNSPVRSCFGCHGKIQACRCR